MIIVQDGREVHSRVKVREIETRLWDVRPGLQNAFDPNSSMKKTNLIKMLPILSSQLTKKHIC